MAQHFVEIGHSPSAFSLPPSPYASLCFVYVRRVSFSKATETRININFSYFPKFERKPSFERWEKMGGGTMSLTLLESNLFHIKIFIKLDIKRVKE